jgi:2-polyprenyl-3-methyl-5-hydroxy-6-metoxy-1,4-benzoquinol methylase
MHSTTSADGWRDISDDPNAREVLAFRNGQLASAWRAPVRSRFEVIGPLVDGVRVLDVGCVDHLGEALRDDSLHGLIRSQAATLVSVDIDEAGIQALQQMGEVAIAADLDTRAGIDAVVATGPFEVIVAGELIEHLTRQASLFDLAAASLAPGGRLVITTPNPFALHRTRSGWRRASWENVDHLAWAFPSGVVELASRSGLVLEAALTCGANSDGSLGGLLRTWRRGIRRRVSLAARSRTLPSKHLKDLELPLGAILGAVLVGARGSEWLGETAIYVCRLPLVTADE